MIKNIIFDMGGVLVNIQLEEAARQFRTIGVTDIHQQLDSNCHKGLFLRFENGDIDTDTFCRLLCEQTGKDIPRPAIEHAWKSLISKPPTYKLKYILALRKKYNVYLLSNNNPIIMDWARTPNFSQMGCPITDYFDKLYLSYEMKCVKPDRSIFEAVIRDSGIRPAETLFIDDGGANINTGNKVGFHTCLVHNGEDWRKIITNQLSINI
jgi:putative hydrolase of the HAD superfamily